MTQDLPPNPAAAVAYPLSELSRTRLWRNSVLSMLGAGCTGSLIVATQNAWLLLALGVFLGLFVYRRMLMRRADPHVVVTGDAVEIRWLRTHTIPLAEVTAVGHASDQVIVLSQRKGDAGRMIHHRLVRWRFEDGGNDLVARLRDHCGLAD